MQSQKYTDTESDTHGHVFMHRQAHSILKHPVTYTDIHRHVHTCSHIETHGDRYKERKTDVYKITHTYRDTHAY